MTELTEFYYARLVTPQQIYLGSSGEFQEPIYADCCACHAEEPIMHGCVKLIFDDTVAVIPQPNGITYRLAYYCQKCFDERTIQ